MKDIIDFSAIFNGAVAITKEGRVIKDEYPEIQLDAYLAIDFLLKHNVESRGWGQVVESVPGKYADVASDRYLNSRDIQEISNCIMESVANLEDVYRNCNLKVLLSPSYLQYFRLVNASGVEGFLNRTRIEVVVCTSEEGLKDHFENLSALQQRDHRHLGKQMKLFSFNEAAPGMAMWLPRGATTWRMLEDYLRSLNLKYGLEEVRSPMIAQKSLWSRSGHISQYLDNIFFAHSYEKERGEMDLRGVIKPMNCPLHVQIFNKHGYTYKDLPVRFYEFGMVHRNEPSGSMSGLFRARAFTQDDAHIFCAQDQVMEEVVNCINMCFEVYKSLGFDSNSISVKLALRPSNSIGDEDTWDKLENILRNALKSVKIDAVELEGEGAFYGPKLELHLKDAMGRSWQCGTIQVDCFMPQRLGCSYPNASNALEYPILIHRAVLGSMERFIGIMLEQNSGFLPLIVSPYQIVLCSVIKSCNDYVEQVASDLRNKGIRVLVNTKPLNLNLKVKEAIQLKMPIMGIIGSKEEANQTISVSWLGELARRKEILSIKDLCQAIKAKI